MTELGLVASAGEEAAQDVLESVYLVELTKALNPLERKDWLRIHRLFVKSLKDTAEPDQAAAVRAMLAKLDIDWKTATPAQVDKVIHAANKAFEAAIAPVIPKLDKVFTTASETIVDGTKRSVVSEWKLPISASFSSTDERIARFVAKSQKNFVRDEMGRRRDSLSAKARGIVERGMEQGLDRHDLGAELERTLNAEGANRSRAYWNMLASVFMVRARSATTLTSFDEAGIDQFQFESVLDEVTSQVCRFMHGRVFSVPAAMQQIAALEAMEDPDAIREAQPFMSVGRDAEGNQTLYYKKGGERVQAARVVESGVGRSDEVGRHSHAKSDADLQAAGVAVPPLHGLCRSNLVPFGDRQAMAPQRPRTQPQPAAAPPPQPAPPPPAAAGVNVPTVTPFAASQRLKDATEKGKASITDILGVPDGKLPVDTATDGFLHHYEESPEADVDVGDLIPTVGSIHAKHIDRFLRDPNALIAALETASVVEHEGQRYIYGAHAAFAAAKLLGMQRVHIGKLIDGDAMLAGAKPQPKPTAPAPQPAPQPARPPVAAPAAPVAAPKPVRRPRAPKPATPAAAAVPEFTPGVFPKPTSARPSSAARPYDSPEEVRFGFRLAFEQGGKFKGSRVREWAQRALANFNLTCKDGKAQREGYRTKPDAEMGGANAYHSSDGVTVRVSRHNRCVQLAQMMTNTPKAIPSRDDLDYIRTILHEEAHAHSQKGNGAYRRGGIGIEEAGTELIARRAIRDIFAGDSSAKAIVARPPKWENGRWTPGNGAYHDFIVGLVDATHEHLGGDKNDVREKLENAFIRMRGPEGPKACYSPEMHGEQLGITLGMKKKDAVAFGKKLADDPRLSKSH